MEAFYLIKARNKNRTDNQEFKVCSCWRNNENVNEFCGNPKNKKRAFELDIINKII